MIVQRKSARRLSIQYGIDLGLSYIIAVIDAAAILIPLRGQMSVAADVDFFEKNAPTLVLLPILGIVIVVVAGILSLTPTLRWYVPGERPNTAQRDAAMRLAGRQTAILLGVWAASGAILFIFNRDDGPLLLPMLLGALLGGPAAAGTAMLLAQRTLRPIMGRPRWAASRDWPFRVFLPGWSCSGLCAAHCPSG